MEIPQVAVVADAELGIDELAPYPFVTSVVSFRFVVLGGQLLEGLGPFVISFFIISHDGIGVAEGRGVRSGGRGAGMSRGTGPDGAGRLCRGGWADRPHLFPSL